MILRANTILYCKRWHETVAFYQAMLPIAQQNDWFIEFDLGNGSYLSVADERRATIKSAEGAGITLAWQVDDIINWRESLLARNIDCTPIKVRWGANVTYFFDPEGHRIELWQPLP